MTALHFPNLDALALALTSEAIPAEVAAAPVEGAFEQAGGVLVFPPQGLPAASRKSLRALGVEEIADDGRPRESLLSWLQVVPLMRRRGPVELSDKTAVLFELENSERLAEVVAEMLRLGNDRQSFRHLEDGQSGRTLLRVLNPPYYTLLRAIDLSKSGESHLQAFTEQRPRIWIELGHEYPLAARLEPPAGKWLLITAPRGWEMIDEGAFHDVYQNLDFRLAPVASVWNEQPLDARFAVHLKLATTSSTDAAELWVVTEDALGQVEELVRTSDNELIGRLAFAATESNGQPLVVLRVRPGKLPPPVLVLRALACRGYLKLPNLFLPVGQRLHPPLRRDAVAKLLAADAAQIVWLHPSEQGQFTPRCLPDAAFRPLSHWVDYVLDREHEPLGAWIAAHRFDFDGFICDDDGSSRPKPPTKDRREKPAPAQSARPSALDSQAANLPDASEPILAEVVESTLDPPNLAGSLPEPSELQRRLSTAERQFVALDEPLDAPARWPLWRELAWLNGALDRQIDASLCWSHLAWNSDQPGPADNSQWCRQLGGVAGELPAAEKLESLIQGDAAVRLDLMRLVASLLTLPDRANAVDDAPDRSRLALAARALERHEHLLPVRLVWLAWLALARLSEHDVLALARARDRLLERLFQQGLTVEHDLPGFLRAGSGGDGDRQRTLRERLLALRDLVAEWITEPPSHLARTRAYADLIFAFGLTRLGETAEAQRIAAWARQQIGTKDTVHGWALAAFDHRLTEAAQGERRAQLAPELLRLMELMERTDRYRADRLRQQSRILEPFERIDPYGRWHGYHPDELSRELSLLYDLTSRDELAGRLNGLLANPPHAAQQIRGRVRLITTALELAPRLGQQFGEVWLHLVLPAWDAADSVVDRAWLLEKALFAAAHFDLRDAVQAFLERFERSLPEIVKTYLTLPTLHNPDRQKELDRIELLFNQSLRGLRKLGLRDEISRIFGQIVTLVRSQPLGRPQQGARGVQIDPTRAAKLLLAVSGGWFFFGQRELAQPVVVDVRQQLFTAELSPIEKSGLATAYVAAVGQAPLDLALPLVTELFDKDAQTGERRLGGLSDPSVTSSHFSLRQLVIVEAAVLTLVSDEFVLSQETRRWLEEDELLVRRRIHRDVREMLERAGG